MLSKNNSVLYQIYPRSFKDSNGDGIGDLPGIVSQLDYLNELGITAIWITPFYPSPMKDGGYDITDYCAIDPEMGTMEDFSRLVAEAHKRDIQIVIDLVLNHTSSEHPWFLESRSSRDNPKRDWYIWHEPVKNGVPNNWKSVFEPSVWEFDKTTGQYYFHSFLKEQPDLNWKNPQVRQAIKEVCKFWMKNGVDAFRLDAVNYIWKDQKFLDEPKNPDYVVGKVAPFYELRHIYMKDQEEIFPLINEIGDFVEAYDSTFIILEAYPNVHGIASIPTYSKYYRSTTSNNSLPFNMELITLPWDAAMYREFVTAYLKALKPLDIPLFVLGNHDRSRVATRIGSEQARTAAVLLLTLPGMPVIYYGEELGMKDVRPIPPGKIHDTKELRSPGFGRDPVRTPMQWDASDNAGFTTGEPWLPLEKDFQKKNAAVERKDPHSMLNLYKKLLALRSDASFILTKGDYQVWETGTPQMFAYTRTFKNKSFLLLLNFSNNKQECRIPIKKYKQILSTIIEERKQISQETLTLLPNEGLILKEI